MAAGLALNRLGWNGPASFEAGRRRDDDPIPMNARILPSLVAANVAAIFRSRMHGEARGKRELKLAATCLWPRFMASLHPTFVNPLLLSMNPDASRGGAEVAESNPRKVRANVLSRNSPRSLRLCARQKGRELRSWHMLRAPSLGASLLPMNRDSGRTFQRPLTPALSRGEREAGPLRGERPLRSWGFCMVGLMAPWRFPRWECPPSIHRLTHTFPPDLSP